MEAGASVDTSVKLEVGSSVGTPVKSEVGSYVVTPVKLEVAPLVETPVKLEVGASVETPVKKEVVKLEVPETPTKSATKPAPSEHRAQPKKNHPRKNEQFVADWDFEESAATKWHVG